jgi:hypothetical protein
MAITTTWSIDKMMRKDSDGGVFLVYWSLIATDGTYSAYSGGKIHCTADPSAADYIAYADLKESDVLSWVYNSLIVIDETAAEAKARIEAERTAKVQSQIDRAAADASGLPW